MIAEIKAKLDIVACLSHFGIDVHPGTRRIAKVRCPFHDDKNPSLAIDVQENRAWCFGCNQGGDVLDLTCLFQSCSISEAIAYWKERLSLDQQTPATYALGLSEPQKITRLRKHIKRRSIESERFDIPKVPVLETSLVYIYSEKDDLDRHFCCVWTQKKLLEYLREIQRWHSWAEKILRNAEKHLDPLIQPLAKHANVQVSVVKNGTERLHKAVPLKHNEIVLVPARRASRRGHALE